jgi:hypothetical protein
VNLELISDILVGAQKATLRRGGSMIDFGDVVVAIVELPTVKNSLLDAGLEVPEAQAQADETDRRVVELQAEAVSSAELQISPALRKIISDLPDNASRRAVLLHLYATGVESGRASLTEGVDRVVRNALLATD